MTLKSGLERVVFERMGMKKGNISEGIRGGGRFMDAYWKMRGENKGVVSEFKRTTNELPK